MSSVTCWSQFNQVNQLVNQVLGRVIKILANTIKGLSGVCATTMSSMDSAVYLV